MPTDFGQDEESSDLGQVLSAEKQDSDKWVSSVKGNLQFMYGAAIATGHASEVDQMLEEILDLIFDWINVERGCIYLLDRQSKKYRPRASRYRTTESKKVELRIGKSVIKYVRDRKEGVLTFNSPEVVDREDGSDSILMDGVQEAICAPISGRATTLGFIYADRLCHHEDVELGQPQFNEDHLKLIVAIGHQVAVSIENAEYYSALMEGERLTAVGRTLAALSHDIKNILQSINGGTHLIEDGLKSDNLEVIKLGWNIVKRNQQHMSNLVMDMVSFSKPAYPHRKFQDLNTTIESVIGNVTGDSEKSKVKIHWKANPDVASVYFDRAMIGRAIENVLRHILDAAGESSEGNILIQLMTKPGNVCVVIKDDFQVVSTAEIDRLFEPFAFESEDHVHGIELAVTQKILREHDGGIAVSKRSKRGVSFSMWLPIVNLDVDDSTGTFNVGLPNKQEKPHDEPQDTTGSAAIGRRDAPGTR